MSFEYPQSSLGQVAKVRSGFAFKSKDWQSAGIPVVKIANVKNGRLDMSGCSFVSEEVAQAAKAFILERGDILISMTGYVGDVARVRLDDLPCALNQRVGRFHSFKRDKIHPEFLFFHLRDGQTRREIEQRAYGSAQPNISSGGIEETQIYLPDLQTQKAIARILGALDDKIELNQKMNQTLEDIAKAIFKSWFVDFDPVRAKAEGRATGLPAEISNLFPDELVDSEIGEIPAGWKSSSLAEIADIQNGYAFKSKDWSDDGEIPVIKIGNVKPTIVDVENCSRVRRAIVSGLDRFKLMRGDILIGMTGYVGEVGLVPNTREMPYLNQRVGRIMPLRNDDYGFVVALCRREEFKSEVENLGTGSAQANVSSGSIKGIRLPLPPQNLRKVFHENASPIIDRILVASEEARCLSDLRDLLLPKLISGELCIPDAEKFLEEAGI